MDHWVHETSGDKMAEWKLYYWHFLPGRGEYVRLIFEEAGVPYDDVCRREDNSESALKFYKGEEDGFPVLAPPIVQKGEFVLSQTPAILQHLGKELGLYPEGGPKEEAHAMQVVLTVLDYHSEGHDAYHPVKKTGSYESQKEEAKPFIERFKAERMPKFLGHLEKTLARNNGGQGFFFGNKVTYADIAVYHVLRATEAQFPSEYASLSFPKLLAFKSRMDARPRIKAYLESSRCQPFCGDSMM